MESTLASRPRSHDDGAEKPLPLDMSHHYSETTKHRVANKIKEFYKFMAIPGINNLAGGMPNVSLFPYDTLEAQVAKPDRWATTPNHPEESDASVPVEPQTAPVQPKPSASSSPAAPPSARVAVPKLLSDERDPARKLDLASALQYGQAQGYPPLLSWVRQFTRENLHPNVPYRGGPEVTLTVGSTDGFSKTLELFVNPWSPERDDPRDRPGLLCERYIYGSILAQSVPKGMNVATVTADGEGMCVEGEGGLEDVLGNWDESKGMRPHLLYTVTMGHNPTGIVLGTPRRKAIYDVCSKYDVIIVEDDPYWYLQFPSAAPKEATSRNLPTPPPLHTPSSTSKSSGYPFLDSLVPSFLSLDTDGRVVRLDTFSKTVAPGCRLGWITAQPALIERYIRISESTTQQPSGFVQSLVAELVMGPHTSTDESPNASALATFLSLRPKDRATFAGWHTAGFVRWLAGLRGAYERRMSTMCSILDEGSVFVKTGSPSYPRDADVCVVSSTKLYDFAWPRGGMFAWLRMHFEAHPLFGAPRSQPSGPGEPVGKIGGEELAVACMVLLTSPKYLVVVALGMMFSATEAIYKEEGWGYCRVCFAAEGEERVESGTRAFVAGVQRFWRIKSVKELEDLLADAPFLGARVEEAQEVDQGGNWFGC